MCTNIGPELPTFVEMRNLMPCFSRVRWKERLISPSCSHSAASNKVYIFGLVRWVGSRQETRLPAQHLCEHLAILLFHQHLQALIVVHYGQTIDLVQGTPCSCATVTSSAVPGATAAYHSWHNKVQVFHNSDLHQEGEEQTIGHNTQMIHKNPPFRLY